RAPGPGNPAVVSIEFVPVAGMQKIDATTPFPTFGEVVSGKAGDGVEGLPARTIDPPPAVGEPGLGGSLLRQFWLSPPLESTQMGFPVEGSVPMLAHAVPVQLLLPQPPAPQLSSCTGTPVGSPGFAVHGFGPVRVEVPVVVGSRMSSGAASAPGSGG